MKTKSEILESILQNKTKPCKPIQRVLPVKSLIRPGRMIDDEIERQLDSLFEERRKLQRDQSKEHLKNLEDGPKKN